MERILLTLCLATLAWSCSEAPQTEKHQDDRNNVVNVKERVKEFSTGQVDIGSVSWTYCLDNYLIIVDCNSPAEQIYLFDRTNYKYITCTGMKGQGPGELVLAGHIGIDEANRRFNVLDFGSYRVLDFELDSLLANPYYIPTEKRAMQNTQFPVKYTYINDTLSYGVMLTPSGSNDFNLSTGRWNMTSGEITPMSYTHPEIEKRRFNMAVSTEHGIYAEGHHYHDLLTICNLDGTLKCNVYGGKWTNIKSNRNNYYSDVMICGDKIVASFSDGKPRDGASGYPTQFLVFDLEGNYLKTLDVGYHIATCSYDAKNNRIILVCDDEIQFAYLDINGIL